MKKIILFSILFLTANQFLFACPECDPLVRDGINKSMTSQNILSLPVVAVLIFLFALIFIIGKNYIVASGILLGAGLGGFFDGIAFHQILQWHNMLSAQLPPTNLIDAKVNMFWDGLFHAGVWIVTVAGIMVLWKAANREKYIHGKRLFGAAIFGWGYFNFVEGLWNHIILGIHNVNQFSTNRLMWDIGFLVWGIVFFVIGFIMIKPKRYSNKDA